LGAEEPNCESSSGTELEIERRNMWIGSKDMRLALSTLVIKLLHSRFETKDNCKTPEIAIKSETTPRAVWCLSSQSKSTQISFLGTVPYLHHS
jgi:hypothetical protein